MRTHADYEAAASEAGVRITELGYALDPWGDEVPYALFDMGDGWGAARFLDAITKRDARDADVIALARQITRGLSRKEFSRELARWVPAHVRYVEEEIETFQSPIFTVRLGYGDCDDHAAIVTACGKALDLPVELAFLDDGGQPGHVFSCFYEQGTWTPAETTIAAYYGEPPLEAAVRLGIPRGDIKGRALTADQKPISIAGLPSPSGAMTQGATAAAQHGITPRGFAHAVLSRMGLPASVENVAAFIAWEKAEGGHWFNGARFNPLNTAKKLPGSRTVIPLAPNYGIQAYGSWDQGIDATARTMQQKNFSAIVAAFRKSGDPASTLHAIRSTEWGTYNLVPENWRAAQGYGDTPDRAGSSIGVAIAKLASIGVGLAAGVLGWRYYEGRRA